MWPSENGWAGFVSLQNEYSLLNRELEADVVPACERHGLGILPYFPLARGLLTGKYRRGRPARRARGSAAATRWRTPAPSTSLEALERYAEERGVSLLEVAIGGLAAQPAVASVIAGATATRPDRRQRPRRALGAERGRPARARRDRAARALGLTVPRRLASVPGAKL